MHELHTNSPRPLGLGEIPNSFLQELTTFQKTDELHSFRHLCVCIGSECMLCKLSKLWNWVLEDTTWGRESLIDEDAHRNTCQIIRSNVRDQPIQLLSNFGREQIPEVLGSFYILRNVQESTIINNRQ